MSFLDDDYEIINAEERHLPCSGKCTNMMHLKDRLDKLTGFFEQAYDDRLPSKAEAVRALIQLFRITPGDRSRTVRKKISSCMYNFEGESDRQRLIDSFNRRDNGFSFILSEHLGMEIDDESKFQNFSTDDIDHAIKEMRDIINLLKCKIDCHHCRGMFEALPDSDSLSILVTFC